MKINNLLAKFRHQPPTSPPQLFLALKLTEDTLQLAIWRVRFHQTEVVKTGSIEFWDGSPESLIKTVDTSLSALTANLSSEPRKIIFGLPPSWLQHDTITPPKKALLKKLCQALDFKPLGFVLLNESLIHYLKIKEGVPPTGILVQLSDTDLTVMLVKLGRITRTLTTSRTDDLAKDLAQALTKLNPPSPLPSRIIVFNGHQDMTEVVQNLTSYDWQAQFSFLHLPQIEALPANIGISAVAIAGGAEVAKSLGLDALDTTNLQELGFVQDQDILPQDSPPPSTPFIPQKPLSLNSLLSRLSHSFSSFSLPSLPHLSLPTPSLLLPLLLIFSLLAAGAAALWFLPQAHITLYLQPKKLNFDLHFILSDQVVELDLEKNLVPATLVTKTVSGQKTIPTTGTALVGEKATGTVTLYNRTSLPKTFPAGTKLTADQLVFTLDEAVTVASKSSGSDYTEIPGKTTAKLTAASIGEAYNLPANTEFQVASYSTTSFIAKNTTPFSGGSAQEVKAVAQADYDLVFQQLSQELKQQALQAFQEEASADTQVLLLDDSLEVAQKDYSASIGEESQQLTLNLSLTLKGFQYRPSDIESLVARQIQTATPKGYHRLNQPISLAINTQTPQDNGLAVSAQAQLLLLPDLDYNHFRSLLKGTTPSALEKTLKTIPGFARAELRLTPHWLPPRLRFLPLNPQRITFTLQSL